MNTTETYYREAIIEAQEKGEGSRTFHISFSSETPVVRSGAYEVLRHEEKSVDLTRLNSIGTLLFNHNPDKPIGKVEWARIENHRGVAEITFDSDTDSENIYQKVKNGSLRGISIGYRVEPKDWSVEKGEKGEMDTYIAERWTPFEISIVSVPADPTVGVNRAIKGEIKMEEKQERSFTEADLNSVRAEVENKMKAQLEAEQTRCAEILRLRSKYNIDNEVADKWITEKRTVQEVKDDILERMALESRPPKTLKGTVEITRDETESFITRASEYMSDKMTNEANRYDDMQNMSLLNACRQLLIFKGNSYKDVLKMDNSELLRTALKGSTGFESLVDNVANKSLHTWQEAGVTYPQITTSRIVKDFRPVKDYTLSAFSGIEQVQEGESLTYDVFFDEGKEFGVNLYRRGFLYTEQMMINDDINILNDMSRKASDSAYRTLNKAVYDVLFNGANIYDGKGLFHADHHNSAGTASKVSIKSLAEGEKAMRKQKDISGQAILDIRPSILLCDPYVGVFAGQLIGSAVDPSYNNAVPNPMKGKYQIVTDPVLGDFSGTSEQNWFLLASPSSSPVIKIHHLQKYSRPTLTNTVNLDNLSFQYQLTFSFAVHVVDFRGIWKNAGVALSNY